MWALCEMGVFDKVRIDYIHYATFVNDTCLSNNLQLESVRDMWNIFYMAIVVNIFALPSNLHMNSSWSGYANMNSKNIFNLVNIIGLFMCPLSRLVLSIFS